MTVTVAAARKGVPMDELRKEAVQALASLSEEQLRLVLAYALCLLDSGPAPRVHTLEDLLEESA